MFKKKGIFLSGMFIIVATLLVLTTSSAYAAPMDKVPVTVTQPDGTMLSLFASGDEYYNWLQDEQGYTVIQDPDSGYYVYADLENGKLVATRFVVGEANPVEEGIRPYLNISPEQIGEIRQAFLDQTVQAAGEIGNAPLTGTINNLVVFIRFSDESEFVTATSTYTNMLNNSTAGANSLRNYYQEVSYSALTVNSTLLPTPGATVISYQDGHPRGYYQPYNAATNPGGYTGGDSGTDRRVREHTLLRDAINYVSGLAQFPSGASIDADSDGVVDSLTFIVSGSPTGWSSLLWPHQWNLYTYTVTINGKTVDGYSFHLNSSLNTGVLAHEMFHVLGSPDLYHYTDNGIQPVGGWDVMEYDANPPQHMGCYMKFKYGGWIGSIPELATPGTYTLNPLTSSTNNCKKIASPYSTTEFFVVEYRNGTGSTFESSLPGTGLLVYRINTLATGNADGPPDEVYIYRPGGTTSLDGIINTANFSSNVGRTAINDSTNPSSFLSNGSDGGLNLCNIGASNATISFDICAGSLFTISGNAGVSGATITYTGGSTTSDGSGLYTFGVPSGWSGTVTPSKTGYTFDPVNRSYTNVFANQTAQDYVATSAGADSYEPDGTSDEAKWINSGSPQSHSIIPASDIDWVKFELASSSAITLETSGVSGADTRMWLYDSSLTQLDFSDDEGTDFYSLISRQCGVDDLPAGTYYAKIDEYGNDSEISSYNLAFNITQTCAGGGYNISGNAGVGGATLSYTDGTPKTATADGSGNYSFAVASGWSGTVTPSKTDYTFTPVNRSYTNVLADQTAQNYTATPTGTPTNFLQDPSFEAYTPNPYWTEASTNFGTPLCIVADCGSGSLTAGPRTGSAWSWFGGIAADETGSLSQTVTFPSGSASLEFYLWIGSAAAGSDTADVFTAKIDGVTVFSADATQISSYPAYTLVTTDVSAYADGTAHTVMFSSVTTGQSVTFNLDDVALLSGPPITGFTISGNAGVSGATLSYTDGTPKTATADGSGLYSFIVSSGWSGTVTPSKTGYTFSPPNRSYTNVLADQTAQNYTAIVAITYTISGSAGVNGVTLSYTDGTPKTATSDGSGLYSFIVSSGWSGTVTPSKAGYTFSPVNRTYTNVLANQTTQNYSATPITFTISGNAGVGGATLSYTDGTPKSSTADGSGLYSFAVSYGWSGTVTPSKTGYIFSPVNKSYTNVLTNQTDQNYAASSGVLWSGITSRGWPMSFIVISSGTQWSTFKLKTDIPACGATLETTSPGPGAITNGQFSQSSTFSFTGQFNSPSTASGTYSYTSFYIYGCGTISQSGTWSASIPVPPTVLSITRLDPTPTSAASIRYSVLFSESVTGVDAGDFSLTTTGSVSGATVSGVSGSSSSYTVTVNTGSGGGDIRLDVVDYDTIVDSTLLPLGGAGAGNGNFTSGESYTTDHIPPSVTSIIRANTTPTGAVSVNYTVTFSESVTGVNTADFTLTTTGVSGAAVSGVSGSGSTYTVTVNTGSGNGTIRLDVTDNNSIVDAVLNPLGGAVAGDGNFTTGEVYSVVKVTIFTDVPLSYWAWSYIERLYNAGVTSGCSISPMMYCPENTVTRAQMAIFLLKGVHGSSYSPPAVGGSTNFADVPVGYWAAPWIKQLAVEGITGGCGGGNYCPEANVTRAQMAVFLLKAKHGAAYSPSAATGVFTDVPIGYWADKWIEQLAAEAITAGCGGGNYCPEADVTRAQMAIFLVKTFGLP